MRMLFYKKMTIHKYFSTVRYQYNILRQHPVSFSDIRFEHHLVNVRKYYVCLEKMVISDMFIYLLSLTLTKSLWT